MVEALTLESLLEDRVPEVGFEDFEELSFENTLSLMDATVVMSEYNITYEAAALNGEVIDEVEVQFEGIKEVGAAIAKGFRVVLGFIAKILYKIVDILLAPFFFIYNMFKGFKIKDIIKAYAAAWKIADAAIDGWVAGNFDAKTATATDEKVKESLDAAEESLKETKEFIKTLVSTAPAASDNAIQTSSSAGSSGTSSTAVGPSTGGSPATAGGGSSSNASGGESIKSKKRIDALMDHLTQFFQNIKDRSDDAGLKDAKAAGMKLEAFLQTIDEGKLKGYSQHAKHLAKMVNESTNEIEITASKINPASLKPVREALAKIAKLVQTVLKIVAERSKDNVNALKNAKMVIDASKKSDDDKAA
jgi:hypothetical protein